MRNAPEEPETPEGWKEVEMPYGTDDGNATTIIHVKLDEVEKLTLDFPEADEEDPADFRKGE